MDKSILFVSNDGGELADRARDIFLAESAKMELVYSASSSGDIAGHDQGPACSILILIHREGAASLEMPASARDARDAEVETWTVGSGSDTDSILARNIANLLVRLIMKGGARAPRREEARPPAVSDPGKSRVRVGLESKGRRGKKVTVISGLLLDAMELDRLATRLKQVCGSGGTVKDGCIEIQGDQRDRVMQELTGQGYNPKRSGG
ncbi:MAG: translation initiation factor [Candidatus Obscuribacterales bacterium]